MAGFGYNFSSQSKQTLLPDADVWSVVSEEEGRSTRGCGACFLKVWNWMSGLWGRLHDMAVKVWKFGRSDPRKVVFAAKMGLALTLLSLLIFLKEPFEDVSKYSVWAILTVVVVFEFSIGATLSKGFNRGLGTLLAGGLSLAVAELAVLTGKWEEVFIIISIYLAAFITCFIKLYPTMKPYEYGFRVFMITFCFIVISGYRTGMFGETAVNRFLLICLGAGVALAVNIFIYPIWAGEDLHKLIANNFVNVAKSLEGCVSGYLQCLEYERIPSKILTYDHSEDPLYKGYRSAVESKSQEDALFGFAVWEPPHGPYKMMKYPWKSYLKVSGALRHCAFAVMALHGCILSEIQAPPHRRRVFKNEMQRVGNASAKVLHELGNKLLTMTKLSPEDILADVHEAAEELQNKIDKRSYLLVNSESWEIGRHPECMEEDGEDELNVTAGRDIGFKSQSEAVLDLSYAQIPRSWEVHNKNSTAANDVVSTLDHPQSTTVTHHPQERRFQKQVSWPARFSFNQDAMPNVVESKTYESASALSLGTFASLLIEFVARLSYLVLSFRDLSEEAKFKESDELHVQESIGTLGRLCRCFS